MWYLALKIIPSKKSRKTIGGNPKKMIGDPRTKLATFPGGVPDHSGREIRGGAKWVAPCVGWCYSSLPRVRSGARSTALSLGQRIFFRELSNELPIATNWPGHSTVPGNGQKGVHFGSIDCSRWHPNNPNKKQLVSKCTPSIVLTLSSKNAHSKFSFFLLSQMAQKLKP